MKAYNRVKVLSHKDRLGFKTLEFLKTWKSKKEIDKSDLSMTNSSKYLKNLQELGLIERRELPYTSFRSNVKKVKAINNLIEKIENL